MIQVQDGQGNKLFFATIVANIKQLVCRHSWMNMGTVDACPKCYKLRSKSKI